LANVEPIQVLFWKNRLIDHPAVVAAVDPALVGRMGAVEGKPWLEAALSDAMPEFPWQRAKPSWLHLAAAIAHHLHRRLYPGTADAFGASLHDGSCWFAMRDSDHARLCILAVARFVASLAGQTTPSTVQQEFAALVERSDRDGLDQTMRAFLVEADSRSIPWHRVASRQPFVRFGYGCRQSLQRESLTRRQPAIAREFSSDKAMGLFVLREIGVPVGRLAVAVRPAEAAPLAETVGFPLVVKPNTGRKGANVAIGLTTTDQVRSAVQTILATGVPALLQSFLPGDDHRLLVVGGKFVAAARREPASVVGDGVSTIQALIDIENRNSLRGHGFRALMNRIVVDGELLRVLADQGLTPANVPTAGQRIKLRHTANISTGGTATDFTDSIHPDNRILAERAARAVGLQVAGVDFLTPDITRSWREVGGGVCELNNVVGLRPHWLANPRHNVVSPILDLTFKPGDTGRIPIALVTGSNGKTTTTRMLGRILRAAGHRVGCATTDGVQVDDEWLATGDLAGTTGASMILKEPTVTAAVLETARDGVLKRGIYVDRCEVAALLNVDREQVGIDGIDTLEQMAQLKRKVIDTARDGFVLHAGDELCQAIVRDLPAGKTILFELDPATPFGREHLAAGGRLVAPELSEDGETIRLLGAGGSSRDIVRVDEIPATLSGRVRHNVENACAAAALGVAMGVSLATIAEGLRSFTATVECSPGRFNLLDEFPVRVLLDFAHNPPSLRRAMAALGGLAANRRVVALTSPGNRPDEQIRDMGRVAAGHADFYICMERVDRRRGRAAGEIAQLMAEGLADAGVPADRVRKASTVMEALPIGRDLATNPNDLLAIYYTETRDILSLLRTVFAPTGTGLPPASATTIPLADNHAAVGEENP
jgi:cyanophycin synthetase